MRMKRIANVRRVWMSNENNNPLALAIGLRNHTAKEGK